MKNIGDQKFCDDFLRGQTDCINDVKHVNGTYAYNLGYNTQYTKEQVEGSNCCGK